MSHGLTDSKGRGAVGSLERPLPRSSRVSEVVERLVAAITLGEYLPGARLPSERDLAASLGAARTTVRSAIAELVERGVLRTELGRGGGSFVQQVPDALINPRVRESITARVVSLRDVSEGIGFIHGAIARAAAERRSDEDCVTLKSRLESYREAKSGFESQRADAELHLAIADASHNLTLQNVLHELESRFSLAAPAHPWGTPEGMRAMEMRALRDHEELVSLIIHKDADGAERVAREHNGIDLEMLQSVIAAMPAASL